MDGVAQRKRQIGVRVDAMLHDRILAAGRARDGSLNKWAVAAFREKLAREAKGKVQPNLEPHHEDARDEFERIWNRALNRWLRKPGKWRCVLDLLSEIWNLPEAPSRK